MRVENKSRTSLDQREKRGRAIAAMGLVNCKGDRFLVSVPTVRGLKMAYEVSRGRSGAIQCDCPEFKTVRKNISDFRCEHILAVKFALADKNIEGATRNTESSPPGIETNDAREEFWSKNATESRASGRGEQEIEAVSSDSTDRQVENKAIKPARLEDTKGELEMKQKQFNDQNLNHNEEFSESVKIQDNVLNFSTTLKELRKNVDPHLVKQREGWRDRNGNVQMVDYVEWHTVADILDETASNWAHTVKDIRQVGDIMTVTVAISIDGVTREGIGTGLVQSEMGIKKAEHDALKRAAVKFGIARDLYKKESDAIEREGSVSSNGDDDFPTNPVAGSLSDLVTAKQLGMIRAIAREIGVHPDEECNSVMSCKTDELSKKAASALIRHLQELQRQPKVAAAQTPLRKAS